MSFNEIINAKKGIALVAHDNKKLDLINWISKHKEKLAQHILYGTGTTGKLINNHTGLEIEKLNNNGFIVKNEQTTIIKYNYSQPFSICSHLTTVMGK